MKIRDLSVRLLVSLLVSVGTYVLLVVALKPVFVADSGFGMHMSFASPGYITLNIVSLMLGLSAGVAAFIVLTPQSQASTKVVAVSKVLSADEKAVLAEVEKAGEITQDSLRFRLGWSKAKLSAVLSNLDRMNLVQRERQGKTYNVFAPRLGSERSGRK